ncbi:hypothetical protein Y032_0526g2937 [Ancylostoma ceylanicum]|uniref:Uncharacterized protein n=1 Tax=Ancylostoma ceylanicum TaxID=53326 RepID=A0A016WSG7_9BILA|nr:hypothetical protein Y032_0526g2937 [Ancylostoma ceylanicum]
MWLRPLAGEASVAMYPLALLDGCGRSPKAHNAYISAGASAGAVEEVHKTIVEERGPSPATRRQPAEYRSPALLMTSDAHARHPGIVLVGKMDGLRDCTITVRPERGMLKGHASSEKVE